ncbi:MAG: hypothetical protein C4547_07005 [Phycisphaerales bacterium]|nr:MAG: hypothetical protein C4547_07005 [Phycisphaerales bacterium]
MKNGTLYSKRVKKHFARLLKPPPAPPADPLDALAASILGREAGYPAGKRCLDRLLETFVNYNEARVCSPEDLAGMLGNRLPHAGQRCAELRQALNDVFERENRMSLDRLKSMKIKEARQFLATIDGVDEYTVASVILRSLGGHAIPVDDAAWALLRERDLVDPDATRGEIQGFLERAISASDAQAFCHTLEHAAHADHKAAAAPAARRRGRSEKVRSAAAITSRTAAGPGRTRQAATKSKAPPENRKAADGTQPAEAKARNRRSRGSS